MDYGVSNMATIVIADDDASMRLLLSETLKIAGHTVLLTEDGMGAIALVEQHTPDLLIVDANMPNLGGLAAIANLRESGIATPAVVLTAESPKQLGAPLDGRTRYLAKPITPPKLIGYVATTLAEFETLHGQ
jgi:CheY-like chemotaxis protein